MDPLIEHVGRRTFLKPPVPRRLRSRQAPVRRSLRAHHSLSSCHRKTMFPAWRRGTRAVAASVPAGCGTRCACAKGAPSRSRAIPSIRYQPRPPLHSGPGGASRSVQPGPTSRSPPPGSDARRGQSRLVPVAWDDALVALTDRVRMLRDEGRADRIAIVTPLISGSLDRLFDAWAQGDRRQARAVRAVRIRGDSNCQPTVLRTRGGSLTSIWRVQTFSSPLAPISSRHGSRPSKYYERSPTPIACAMAASRGSSMSSRADRSRLRAPTSGSASSPGTEMLVALRNDPGHRRRKAISRTCLTTT